LIRIKRCGFVILVQKEDSQLAQTLWRRPVVANALPVAYATGEKGADWWGEVVQRPCSILFTRCL